MSGPDFLRWGGGVVEGPSLSKSYNYVLFLVTLIEFVVEELSLEVTTSTWLLGKPIHPQRDLGGHSVFMDIVRGLTRSNQYRNQSAEGRVLEERVQPAGAVEKRKSCALAHEKAEERKEEEKFLIGRSNWSPQLGYFSLCWENFFPQT